MQHLRVNLKPVPLLFKGEEGWFRTPFLNCGKVRQFTFQSLSNQARVTGVAREDARATLASDALPAMSSYVWQEIKIVFSCIINRAGISTTVRSIFTKWNKNCWSIIVIISQCQHLLTKDSTCQHTLTLVCYS